MLNLGHTAYATTASSQHCFLGTQMQKHLLWKQRVSEKNQTFFVSWKQKNASTTNVPYTCKWGKHNVSATMFPRLWEP